MFSPAMMEILHDDAVRSRMESARHLGNRPSRITGVVTVLRRLPGSRGAAIARKPAAGAVQPITARD